MWQTTSIPADLRSRHRLLDLLLTVFMASSITGGAFLFQTGNVAHAAIPAVHSIPNGLPKNGSGTPPLFPYSHDIQYHPKIYLDFWGSKWNNDTNIIKQVAATFEALAGTPYNNTLSQYTNGKGNYVHNDVQLMGTWIDPASRIPSYIDITDEVGVEEKNAVRHFHLPYGHMNAMHDIQVIVFPMKGTSYFDGGAFCGMHYFDGTSGAAYGLVQYADSHCNFTGDVGKNIAWTAVHEYAEAATDRTIYGTVFKSFFGKGWQTHDNGWAPDEVADLCEGWNVSNSNALNDLYSAPRNAHFTVPYLWSNQAKACVVSRTWPAANACPPTLRPNSSGTWVRVLQRVLNAYKYNYGYSTSRPKSWKYPLKIDGKFGAQTEAAVIDFQHSMWAGLGSSGGGAVAARTWAALGFCEGYVTPRIGVLADDTGNTGLTNCPAALAIGSSGIWVEALQMRLNQAFYYGMFADSPNDFETFETFIGIHPMFDSYTAYAVNDFQSTAKNGKIPGGGFSVGNRTWSDLGMCW